MPYRLTCKSSCLLLPILVALLAGCGANGPCDGKACVRVTNQHQELGSPAEIHFDRPGAMSVGQLAIPVDGLAFAHSTDWFDPADGALERCGPLVVMFEARTDPSQPWSPSQVYEFSNQPSCFVQNQRYELVVR